MEVSGQLHASVALPPEEAAMVPFVYGAGWAPEPVWPLWSKEKSNACTEYYL
jgi:hypothetical protein